MLPSRRLGHSNSIYNNPRSLSREDRQKTRQKMMEKGKKKKKGRASAGARTRVSCYLGEMRGKQEY